jgi:RNA polymerase sigma factor (sigma-70 family)
MDNDSVTVWIRSLSTEEGEEAAQRLWEHYFERLVRLARKRLGPGKRRMSDEEDVVLSAFDSFCRGAAAGRFPRLEDRDDLWKLLVRITCRTAYDHQKRECRDKRGGGAVRGNSAFSADLKAEGCGGIEQVMGHEPTPEFAAQVVEEYEQLLGQLEDDVLREIAVLRLESYSVAEIGQRLGCSLRTVKRRLAIIRQRWEEEGDEPI